MSVTPEQPSLNEVVQATEKAALEQRLKRNRGNVSKTARELKVSRMTLYRLMAKHNIGRA
jgi:transcriptional regulator of acetoin/glycerol metabolism